MLFLRMPEELSLEVPGKGSLISDNFYVIQAASKFCHYSNTFESFDPVQVKFGGTFQTSSHWMFLLLSCIIGRPSLSKHMRSYIV